MFNPSSGLLSFDLEDFQIELSTGTKAGKTSKILVGQDAVRQCAKKDLSLVEWNQNVNMPTSFTFDNFIENSSCLNLEDMYMQSNYDFLG